MRGGLGFRRGDDMGGKGVHGHQDVGRGRREKGGGRVEMGRRGCGGREKSGGRPRRKGKGHHSPAAGPARGEARQTRTSPRGHASGYPVKTGTPARSGPPRDLHPRKLAPKPPTYPPDSVSLAARGTCLLWRVRTSPALTRKTPTTSEQTEPSLPSFHLGHPSLGSLKPVLH